MKKTAIASVALAAALFAVSCQKENTLVENVSGPMTISAVAEGLNTPTKTEMIFKYDVAWSANDKIYVKDASGNNDTFSLTGGAGTTKGTFKQDGEVALTGEVEAYYPATMLESGSPLWPASQTNDQTIPMYCKKTLSGTAEERMDFSSLGSVLQIVFNTTQENVTLKSIEIKDGSATLSGAFTVNNNGMAIITATDKAGITLDLGEGVVVGLSAKYFNISVPSGNYEDLTLIFTAKDGKKCEMTGGKVNIAYNTVGRLTLTGKEFKIPGALSGLFTVGPNATDKVYFSQGNLWYGPVTEGAPATFNFEANQYDTTPASEVFGIWSSDHISHFFWSRDASVAYSGDYDAANSEYTITPYQNDVFFTNDPEDEKKPNSNFKVNVGGTDQTGWRTLSTNEWQYLFNGRNNASNLYKYGVTVCGVTSCVVIAPDGWDLSANSLQSEYSSTSTPMTWEQAETAGLVCLPAAGSREDSYVRDYGGEGNYWSSTARNSYYAYFVIFDMSYVSDSSDNFAWRYSGFSVRLITDVK